MTLFAIQRRGAAASCTRRYLPLLAVLALLGGFHAAAADPRSFDIATGEASATLRDFGRQAGLQLLFDYNAVKHIETQAVSGQLEAEVALAEMLRGTGLAFDWVNDRTVAIRPLRGAVLRAPASLHTTAASADPLALVKVSAVVTTEELPGNPASPVSNSQSGELEEVLVTGSRIRRTVEDNPAPTVVLGTAAIARTGFDNIYDVMTETPQFGTGVGPTSNNGYSSDAGATFLNLRGLGTNRTLVLIDGLRRVSGTASSSAVDLASIPAGMIDHVEVTTGGAAAVYGADAVTGVVNVILKHPTEGIDLSVKGGISGYGDDERTSANAVLGQTTERTEFSLGLSYAYEPVVHAEQRPFSRESQEEFPNPNITASNPYLNLNYTNYRFVNTSYGSAFTIGNTRYTIGANGQLRPTQNNALPYGPLSYLGIGGDGFNEADFDVLRLGSKIFSAMSRFVYKVSDNIRFTTDFQFGHTSTDIPLQPNYEFLTIGRSNPFVPASVGALMDQYGLTELPYGRTDVDQGISHTLGDRSTYTFVTKLDGDAGARFKWDVSYQYGYFQGQSTYTGNRVNSRYSQAIDVVEGPTGPECADSTAVAAGCRPLNIFGPNAANPAALAYFLEDSVTNVANSQQVIGAHLNGSVVHLPAGPLEIAAGLEYRTESQDVKTDPLGSEGLLEVNNGPDSNASFNVKEVFAEALVPLVKDLPFAKTLDVEAAVRRSDYNTIGSATAWKLGGVWAPTSSLRFRVTRSSDVRAPNLTELFSPGINSLSQLYDPCAATYINSGSSTRAANCAALGIPSGYVDSRPGDAKTLVTQGNPNLRPEVSKDWTAGVEFTPTFIPRLKVSADWWSIDIDEAVTTLQAQQIVNDCVDASTLTNPYCALVTRGGAVAGVPVPDIELSKLTVEPVNAASLEAEGVDFETQYSTDLPTHFLGVANGLSFAFGGAYYMKNTTYAPGTGPLPIAGDSQLPKLRMNLTTEFTAGRLLLDWTNRFISSSEENVTYAPLYVNDNHVASRLYNDLGGSYQINDALRVHVGINNVFGVIPPQTSQTFEGIGLGGLYDNIGRYFFIDVHARL